MLKASSQLPHSKVSNVLGKPKKKTSAEQVEILTFGGEHVGVAESGAVGAD